MEHNRAAAFVDVEWINVGMVIFFCNVVVDAGVVFARIEAKSKWSQSSLFFFFKMSVRLILF